MNTSLDNNAAPRITRVSGPIVTASGMAAAQMYEVVHVGEAGLVGEVVRVRSGTHKPTIGLQGGGE